jgi:hypothetical protein
MPPDVEPGWDLVDDRTVVFLQGTDGWQPPSKGSAPLFVWPLLLASVGIPLFEFWRSWPILCACVPTATGSSRKDGVVARIL